MDPVDWNSTEGILCLDQMWELLSVPANQFRSSSSWTEPTMTAADVVRGQFLLRSFFREAQTALFEQRSSFSAAQTGVKRHHNPQSGILYAQQRPPGVLVYCFIVDAVLVGRDGNENGGDTDTGNAPQGGENKIYYIMDETMRLWRWYDDATHRRGDGGGTLCPGAPSETLVLGTLSQDNCLHILDLVAFRGTSATHVPVAIRHATAQYLVEPVDGNDDSGPPPDPTRSVTRTMEPSSSFQVSVVPMLPLTEHNTVPLHAMLCSEMDNPARSVSADDVQGKERVCVDVADLLGKDHVNPRPYQMSVPSRLVRTMSLIRGTGIYFVHDTDQFQFQRSSSAAPASGKEEKEENSCSSCSSEFKVSQSFWADPLVNTAWISFPWGDTLNSSVSLRGGVLPSYRRARFMDPFLFGTRRLWTPYTTILLRAIQKPIPTSTAASSTAPAMHDERTSWLNTVLHSSETVPSPPRVQKTNGRRGYGGEDDTTTTTTTTHRRSSSVSGTSRKRRRNTLTESEESTTTENQPAPKRRRKMPLQPSSASDASFFASEEKKYATILAMTADHTNPSFPQGGGSDTAASASAASSAALPLRLPPSWYRVDDPSSFARYLDDPNVVHGVPSAATMAVLNFLHLPVSHGDLVLGVVAVSMESPSSSVPFKSLPAPCDHLPNATEISARGLLQREYVERLRGAVRQCYASSPAAASAPAAPAAASGQKKRQEPTSASLAQAVLGQALTDTTALSARHATRKGMRARCLLRQAPRIVQLFASDMETWGRKQAHLMTLASSRKRRTSKKTNFSNSSITTPLFVDTDELWTLEMGVSMDTTPTALFRRPPDNSHGSDNDDDDDDDDAAADETESQATSAPAPTSSCLPSRPQSMTVLSFLPIRRFASLCSTTSTYGGETSGALPRRISDPAVSATATTTATATAAPTTGVRAQTVSDVFPMSATRILIDIMANTIASVEELEKWCLLLVS